MEAAKTLRAEFNVFGLLRYLSHRQTMKMFQRAFLRSDIKIAFSQGFNPRPKMSLPLPRPVGVESRGDVLVAKIENGEDVSLMTSKLIEQMPNGCEITSVDLFENKASFVVDTAKFAFVVKDEYLENSMMGLVGLKKQLETGEPINIERARKKGGVKIINAADFIKDARVEGNVIILKVGISQSGALRVEEMLEILNLTRSMLCESIKRFEVEWQK